MSWIARLAIRCPGTRPTPARRRTRGVGREATLPQIRPDHLGEGATRRQIAEFAARPEQHRPDPTAPRELTDQDREALTLVAGALSHDEVAEHLVISPATSRAHVRRIMTKARCA
ncbi:helix-turn-helix transcriptional regulator [Kutzneria sp. CA-103260]|uniref:helix-turn-helix transcriptional regulator n=1 Tax=Kutzneria sp. CA-103260 TaxID=2802641 RepID=UPI003FA53234